VVEMVYKWLKTTRLSIESEDAKLVDEVVIALLQFIFICLTCATIHHICQDATCKSEQLNNS